MSTKHLASAAAALTLFAAPAVAVAHSGNDDHGRDRGRHHHRHHVKPVAGTVTSFTAGELTVTLNNGKVYAGQVTRRTVLKCTAAVVQSATARAARHGSDDPAGDHRGRGNDDGANHDVNDDHGNDNAPSSTTPSTTAPSTTVPAPTTPGDTGVLPTPGHHARCAAALVAGAKFTEAKLALNSTGAVWKKVVLVK